MALGFIQPLTGICTKNFPERIGRSAPKADNFTTICEPIVYKICDPRHPTALGASMDFYRHSFAFFTFFGLFNYVVISSG
jgi:hypothetical protein